VQQTALPRRTPAATLRGFATRAVREHWLLLIFLTIGLVLRILVQIAYRPALLYIDSFRYLYQLQSLDPRGLNPIGYSLFVLKPIMAVGGLGEVALFQHLSTLVMAVAIYALLVHKGAWRWLSAVATTPLLFDGYQLQIEHMLMSDQPFQMLLVGMLLVLAWKDRPSGRASAVAGVLLAVMIMFRLVAVTMAVPVLVYLLIVAGAWRDREAWRRRLVTVGSLLAALLVCMVSYVAYFHAWSGQWGLTSSKSSSILGRVTAVADCPKLDLTAEQRRVCPAEPLDMRNGPDFYTHSPNSPVAKLTRAKVPGDQVQDWTRALTAQVLKKQPMDVAGAILVDFAKGFRWQHSDSPGDVPVSRWQFKEFYPEYALNPYRPDPDELPRFLREDGYSAPIVERPLADYLREYQLVIGYTPGPALAAALLAGIAGVCTFRGRRTWLRAPTLLVVGAGVTLLGTAAVVEFSWRYQLPALVLLPIAGVLGITALRKGRSAPPPSQQPDPPTRKVVEFCG
jgi:hypothetical protein